MAKKSEALAMLMLRPGSKAPFQRCIREKGKVVQRLSFPPGTPVEMTDQGSVDAVYADVGKALVIVELNEHGQPHVDWEATQEVVEERERAEQGDDYEETQSVDPTVPLIQAGVSEDNAKLLELNVKKHGDWLLNPEAIVTKVKEGFKLSTLAKIGDVTAAEIADQLGIKSDS